MVDVNGNSKLVHYVSSRCKRDTLSFMAAEIHALVLGFYLAYVVRETAKGIFQKYIPIESCTDIKTVFHAVSKDGKPTDLMLHIYVVALK